jgi:hypothetical protein
MLDRLLIALRLKPRPFNWADYQKALRGFNLRYLARSRS